MTSSGKIWSSKYIIGVEWGYSWVFLKNGKLIVSLGGLNI